MDSHGLTDCTKLLRCHPGRGQGALSRQREGSAIIDAYATTSPDEFFWATGSQCRRRGSKPHAVDIDAALPALGEAAKPRAPIRLVEPQLPPKATLRVGHLMSGSGLPARLHLRRRRRTLVAASLAGGTRHRSRRLRLERKVAPRRDVHPE